MTVPDCPTNLQAIYLSPVQIKTWCDKVKGAEKYVFDIDGETITKEHPEHVYDHGKEREFMKISVSALCAEQRSLLSEIPFTQSKSFDWS